MRILVVAAVITMLFSQAAAAQNADTVKPAAAVKTISGRVDSINRIDPATGSTEGTIIIIDGEENESAFTINENTIFTDESSKTINSDDILDGDSVRISFVTSEMGNIAADIFKMKKQK